MILLKDTELWTAANPLQSISLYESIKSNKWTIAALAPLSLVFLAFYFMRPNFRLLHFKEKLTLVHLLCMFFETHQTGKNTVLWKPWDSWLLCHLAAGGSIVTQQCTGYRWGHSFMARSNTKRRSSLLTVTNSPAIAWVNCWECKRSAGASFVIVVLYAISWVILHDGPYERQGSHVLPECFLDWTEGSGWNFPCESDQFLFWQTCPCIPNFH